MSKLILLTEEEMIENFNYGKNDLYFKYNNLVHKIARSFKLTRNIEYDDLISAGYIGVVNAHSNKYNKDKSAIQTFTYLHIFKEMTNEYRKMLNTVHVPYETQTSMNYGYERQKYNKLLKAYKTAGLDITEEEKDALKEKLKIDKIEQLYESDHSDDYNRTNAFDNLLVDKNEIIDISEELNSLLENNIITENEYKDVIEYYYEFKYKKNINKIIKKIEKYKEDNYE